MTLVPFQIDMKACFCLIKDQKQTFFQIEKCLQQSLAVASCQLLFVNNCFTIFEETEALH